MIALLKYNQIYSLAMCAPLRARAVPGITRACKNFSWDIIH